MDIAGLVKGASKGEGLGNAFLSHIKETDAIYHVVRAFNDEDIVHIELDVNPIRDIGIINDELVLKDLEIAAKRLKEVEGKLAKMNKKEDLEEKNVLDRVVECLEANKWLT